MSTEHIKYRNMLMQVVLMVITLGIYAIYWYYVTLREMQIAIGKDESAVLWTILLFIPFVNLLSYWRHSADAAQFTNDKYPAILLFLLWIFFSPAMWFMVQRELNAVAPQPGLQAA